MIIDLGNGVALIQALNQRCFNHQMDLYEQVLLNFE